MKVAKIRGFYKSCYAGWPTKIYLVMRLTALFLFAACLEVQAHGYSQGKLSVSEKDAPLPQVLQDIERQSDYHFFYDYPIFDQAAKVSVDLKNVSIEQVLDVCFKDQPFAYSIEGKLVLVKRKGTVPPVPVNRVPGMLAELKGKVTNESGEPLQGASVEVKNMNTGSFTDAHGIFILKNIPADAVLEISFTGYQKTMVKVVGTGSLNIVLKMATNSLDQVQIIAYGTTTQRLNTGDVSTVSSQEIEEQPVTSPLEALEGRVPGLFIAQNTGAPGSSFTVQLRGVNSIANGNDPLFIIDGVPYSSELLPGLNPSGGNPLNFINTSDIASIEVLKDADATAIYGSRGANGVVIITTKKGKAGKMKIDINAYTGFGKITHQVDFLNTQQYLGMRHEAFANDGVTPNASNAPDLLTWDTSRYTNWEKKLIGGTAGYTDAQGSISGGNANTQFVLGGGYHRQTTVFPGSFYDQRGSMHISINSSSLDQRFHIQFSGNYMADGENLIGQDLTGLLLQLPPDAPPVHNSDGTLNWAQETWPSGGNPYAKLLITYKGNTSNLITNSVISYNLLKGLDLLTSLGYTALRVNETILAPASANDPAYGVTSGNAQFVANEVDSWIVEPQMKYQLVFGKSKLNALVGTTFESMTTNGQILYASGFTSDALLNSIQSASSVTVSSETNAQYKYDAIFGRLNYNVADKYLLDFTVRRDGSSRFGPANRFSNFGAVGAAWLFSQEDFMQRAMPVFSSGKLRASYGITGNDQIGDYKYLDLYNSAQYPYEGTLPLAPANLYNPDLAWERNRKAEVGLELGLCKDRVLGSLSYYEDRSSNQLVNAGVSAVTGFSSIEQNLHALVQNTGWEVSLKTTDVKTKSFRWATILVLTIPKNKLVSFPGLSTSSYSNQFVIGQPLTVRRLLHVVGVNDTTGVYQFTSAKGGITSSPSTVTDITSSVNTAPTYYGGFSNTLQYRQFSLDFFFQVVHQRGYNFYYGDYPGQQGYQQPTYVLRRWQQQGNNTNIQKFSESYASPAFLAWVYAFDFSDQMYGTASYVRMKNLSFSYNLPTSSLQRLHLENVRLYIQGQNLLTFTKYVGYDPETQSTRSVPPMRVLTAGIQITL